MLLFRRSITCTFIEVHQASQADDCRLTVLSACPTARPASNDCDRPTSPRVSSAPVWAIDRSLLLDRISGTADLRDSELTVLELRRLVKTRLFDEDRGA